MIPTGNIEYSPKGGPSKMMISTSRGGFAGMRKRNSNQSFSISPPRAIIPVDETDKKLPDLPCIRGSAAHMLTPYERKMNVLSWKKPKLTTRRFL